MSMELNTIVKNVFLKYFDRGKMSYYNNNLEKYK